MLWVLPTTLQRGPVRLVPMTLGHEAGLAAAAADGELWNIRVTSVPEPGATRGYIEAALRMQEEGTRIPFVVLDSASGQVIGSSSYHDIVPALDRLEIGYTWYGKSHQRSAVNTTAKWLMMNHAFETLRAPRRLAHRQLQLCQPTGHRTAGRAQRRCAAPPRPAPRRHSARHRDVQLDGGRMARSESAS